MPLSSTKALVLGSSLINEQDKLVFLLTPGRGIIRAIAPGAARGKNRFGSVLELFTAGDFQYYWNEEKERITLTQGEITRSFFPVVSRPENIFYFYLMAEIVLKFVPHHHRDHRHYRLLLAILKTREEGAKIGILLVYFLVWILKIEGLLFPPDACSNCQNRDLPRAWVREDFRGILCPECRRNESLTLSGEDLRFIRWALTHSPTQRETWVDAASPARLVRLLIRQIEYHGEFTLKSIFYLPEYR
jgi:DNA repair protein RecO (recombination protein O)